MKGNKIFMAALVLIGWSALIAQFILHLEVRQVDLAESLVRFFSYFTVLINLLVAICYTALLFEWPGNACHFFKKPGVQTAVTVYITIVGVIYNLILRNLWHSEGLQYLLHDVLHSVIPILCVLYWWLWCDGKELTWKMIPRWLIYPLVYTLFVLFRGSLSGWYAYPFFDIPTIGIASVIQNTALLLLVFVAFSLLFLFAGKKKSGPQQTA